MLYLVICVRFCKERKSPWFLSAVNSLSLQDLWKTITNTRRRLAFNRLHKKIQTRRLSTCCPLCHELRRGYYWKVFQVKVYQAINVTSAHTLLYKYDTLHASTRASPFEQARALRSTSARASNATLRCLPHFCIKITAPQDKDPVHTYPDTLESANFPLPMHLPFTSIQWIRQPNPQRCESALHSGNVWIRHESDILWTSNPVEFVYFESDDVTKSVPVFTAWSSNMDSKTNAIASLLTELISGLIACFQLNLSMFSLHINFVKRRLVCMILRMLCWLHLRAGVLHTRANPDSFGYVWTGKVDPKTLRTY